MTLTIISALHLEVPVLALHRRVLRNTQHRNNIIHLNLKYHGIKSKTNS
jgi:hypothetical protein